MRVVGFLPCPLDVFLDEWIADGRAIATPIVRGRHVRVAHGDCQISTQAHQAGAAHRALIENRFQIDIGSLPERFEARPVELGFAAATPDDWT